MKKCSKCFIELPLTSFYDKKRSKTRVDGTVHNWMGKYAKCKTCTDKVNIEASHKYKDYYKEYRKINKDKISVKTKAHYIEMKLEWVRIIKTYVDLKCSSCGYDKNFAGLDFHHKDPKEKENTIHQIMKLGVPTPERVEVLQKELVKCTVLCATCHRVEHSKYDLFKLLEE
jgi:hypothetical protein